MNNTIQPQASPPISCAVVLLNWNGSALLRQLLPTLIEHTPEADLWVVDNASTDHSLEIIAQHPQIHLLRINENLGYAGGYNHALQHIEAEYLVLLNTDVEVTPSWLDAPLAMMQSDPTIAAVQPKILDYYRRTHYEYAGAAGGMIDRWGYPYCRGRIRSKIEENNGSLDQPTEIFWASGAALFIRRTAFIEAGGFDASLFAHQEEIDLCWRLQLLGYSIRYTPHSTVYHMGGATLQSTSPQKTYLNFRNNRAILRKNLPPNEARTILPIRWTLDILASIVYLLQGKTSLARAVWRALRDAQSLVHTTPPTPRRPLHALKGTSTHTILLAPPHKLYPTTTNH